MDIYEINTLWQWRKKSHSAAAVPPKSRPNASRKTKREYPTLLEFLASFHYEAHKQLGDEIKVDCGLSVAPLPHWAQKTVGQFRKTILKPVLKLRPSPKTTCEDYGKIIGIIKRGITFYRTDVWKILEEENLDKISPEDWEKIQPQDQMRRHVVKRLGRPVDETEPLDNLVEELMQKQIKHLENLTDQAFCFMANRSAKDNAKFLKGVAQGYEIFMDEDARYCGDRGRTEIYMVLLSSAYEIEKMRRMLPSKNDDDLFDHLKQGFKFPKKDRKQAMSWLRDVCDDISLYMTGKRGPRAGVSRLKTGLTF